MTRLANIEIALRTNELTVLHWGGKMSDRAKEAKDPAPSVASRPRRSSTRPVSQVVLRLAQKAGTDRFDVAVDAALRWMNRRAGKSLPAAAWARQSFELADVGAQRVAAVRLDEPVFWSARIDDADKIVPMRTWTTEIGVVKESSGSILLGVRLICSTRGEDAPYQRSVPGFVREVLSKGPAELDGRLAQRTPWVVDGEAAVHALVGLLESTNRITDVVVISLPDGVSDVRQAACSASSIAAKLYGAAHVAVITDQASYLLTDSVGRELSAFNGAVRIYRPQFRAWLDDPYRHPLIFARRIQSWNGIGAAAFEDWLMDEVLADGIRHPNREELVPSFTTVRQIATQRDLARLKSAGGDNGELASLYAEDNERLRRDLVEQKQFFDELLQSAEAERDLALEGIDRLRAQSLERLHRIRELEARARSAKDQSSPSIPNRLDELETWCKEHLAGYVEVLSKAFQGARKSVYETPSLVYESLLLLRDYYVPMRIESTPEYRERYLRRLAELQLEESFTGEAAERGSSGYVVQYGSERRPVDLHLKKGNSRDPRYCFRLYFFWDEVEQVAVVGWLPSHLDNRLT